MWKSCSMFQTIFLAPPPPASPARLLTGPYGYFSHQVYFLSLLFDSDVIILYQIKWLIFLWKHCSGMQHDVHPLHP